MIHNSETFFHSGLKVVTGDEGAGWELESYTENCYDTEAFSFSHAFSGW